MKFERPITQEQLKAIEARQQPSPAEIIAAAEQLIMNLLERVAQLEGRDSK